MTFDQRTAWYRLHNREWSLLNPPLSLSCGS